MYGAKEMGRRRYSFHAAEMITSAMRHMALGEDCDARSSLTS